MRKAIWLSIVTALGLVLLAGGAVGCSTTTPTDTIPYYPPGGTVGPGGMTGPSGIMGTGGMMGSVQFASGGDRIDMEQAIDIAEEFLRQRGEPGLIVAEVMEFSYNFYVQFEESGTGIHAMEALIDPYTRILYPESGPNMMWNIKYGAMSGLMWGLADADAAMSITESEAKQLAQDFVDDFLPGGGVGHADLFYGYYTLHILQDGDIYGMLSVNGFTGQVWFHHWHGAFSELRELD